MYKYILESAGDINWMAISALITFVTIFTVSSVLVLRRDNTFIKHMANLPLDENQPNSNDEKESNYEK